MIEEGKAFFVEDFFHEGDKIRIIAFDIELFYQQLLNKLNQLMPEELSINQLLTTSPHKIGLRNYREAFCSIEEYNCFSEFSVLYLDNEELFKEGFIDEFYSIRGGRLHSEVGFNSYPFSWHEFQLDYNPYVLKAIKDYNFFTRHVKKDDEEKNFSLKGNIYAAIVNVGFGNCCFIFDEEHTIAVDCSNHETCGKYYQNNVDAAISWILSKQKKETFHIDVFLLSHPHYDHYSGIYKMIEREYINDKTKFYINKFYRRRSPSISKIFAYLNEAGIKYTHPTVWNGIKGFEILHPIHSHRTYKNPNNSSVIVSIDIGQGNFVIPGDIEKDGSTEGWDEVSLGVKKVIQQVKYYMLSHHGSKNGFCSNAIPLKTSLSFCSTRRRPNYHDVPHKRTLRAFRHLCKTNRWANIQFIEVDFLNGTAVYKR